MYVVNLHCIEYINYECIRLLIKISKYVSMMVTSLLSVISKYSLNLIYDQFIGFSSNCLSLNRSVNIRWFSTHNSIAGCMEDPGGKTYVMLYCYNVHSAHYQQTCVKRAPLNKNANLSKRTFGSAFHIKTLYHRMHWRPGCGKCTL